jgi:hypothetical protein
VATPRGIEVYEKVVILLDGQIVIFFVQNEYTLLFGYFLKKTNRSMVEHHDKEH